MSAPLRSITPAPVRKTVHVKVPPARAFDVFTGGISRWWPAPHTILKAPLKDTIIEPFVGGRWYQVGEDGSECDLGRVLAWEPARRLVLSWQLSAEWRYDPQLVTEIEINFIAEDGATRVEFEHRHLERMGERAETVRSQIDAPGGWTAILESFRLTAEE